MLGKGPVCGPGHTPSLGSRRLPRGAVGPMACFSRQSVVGRNYGIQCEIQLPSRVGGSGQTPCPGETAVRYPRPGALEGCGRGRVAGAVTPGDPSVGPKRVGLLSTHRMLPTLCKMYRE